MYIHTTKILQKTLLSVFSGCWSQTGKESTHISLIMTRIAFFKRENFTWGGQCCLQGWDRIYWDLEVEQTSSPSAGWELRVLPPPASPAHAHSTWHPSASSQLPFWCKPTCTSKCFWPSVHHRQRFPVALISLTLIYFKILHRFKKTPNPNPPSVILQGLI